MHSSPILKNYNALNMLQEREMRQIDDIKSDGQVCTHVAENKFRCHKYIKQ